MQGLLKIFPRGVGGKSYRLVELRYILRKFRTRYLRMLLQVCGTAFASLVFAILWLSPVGLSLDQLYLRYLFHQRGSIAPPSNLVLVGVDEKSFAELNLDPRWPLPRKYTATAMETIIDANPAVVIMDMTAIFEDRDPEADQRLVNAFKRGKVTIGKGWAQNGDKALADNFYLLVDPKFEKATSMQLPMFFQMSGDMIWAMNRFPPGKAAADDDRFPLLAPLRELAGIPVAAPSPQSLINFYGPAGTIPRIPFYELVKEGREEVAKQLAGKVVVFGFQSIARIRGQMYQEEFKVPVSRSMFGAEIHATIAGNLMQGSWLNRLPIGVELSLLFSVFWALLLLTLMVPVTVCWWIVFGITAVCAGASYILFASHNFFVPGIPLLILGLIIVLGPISAIRAFRERYSLLILRKNIGLDKDEKKVLKL